MSRAWFLLLCALSLSQMVGTALGLEAVAGLAAATVAAPAPKVFTSSSGLESFSSRYRVGLENAQGEKTWLTLDATQTDALRGPYNRRNPYGAVLVFAPLLQDNPKTRALFESVSRYALCGEGKLLKELGMHMGVAPRSLTIVQEPRPGTQTELPLIARIPCY